ncbi:MAG: heavy metal translocating P-type ATPase [Rubripirellula sp.]|nr:heavy metal translocating P-type ATPase [Rubripirellula sp.]
MSTATIPPNAPNGVPCAHCGLPAPRPRAGQTESFCCHGCRGAWELIRTWGLEEYYQLRDSPGEEIDEEATRNWDDLDDPRLLGRSAPLAVETDSRTPLLRSTLAISGIHCAACLWLIERAPERIAGWHSSQVNMHQRTVELTFDPTTIRLSEIGRWLHRVGYSVEPLADSEDDSKDEASQQLLVDLALAGFCAANAMWIAIALYAGQFTGMAANHQQFLRIAGVGLGVAAVIFPGRIFFRSAIASVQTRTPHMDLPVAIGLMAGMLASIYALIDRDADVYFDSIACLVFFLLTGRWLQLRQQRRAGEAVATLMRLSPTVATRLNPDGSTARVAAETLALDDHIIVRPGESIPVDGTIISGKSMVDRSLMTGESCPVQAVVGNAVEAGTENLQADLHIQVTARGDETRLANLQRAVADAAATRTPIIQLANRIGAWFVVVVLLLSLATAIAWFLIDRSQMMGNVVALLIVACPCALALATPLAIAVSIGRLAKRQVLVRSGDCLERLSRPGILFLDKTGTLTKGRMQVSHWIGDNEHLPAVGKIEAGIRHPIAHALTRFVEAELSVDLDSLPPASKVNQQVGRGVEGEFQGQHYRLGSVQLLGTPDFDNHNHNHTPQPSGEECLDDRWKSAIESVIAAGSSPVVLMKEQQCRGVFGVSDPLRDEASDVIQWFINEGWQIEILSGDHQPTVSQVASKLGLSEESARGGLLPNEKLAFVQAAAGKLPVIMVGDGVNDAAALAAADVGVAVRGGASASLAAAPIVIDGGSLTGVQSLVVGARQARQTIRRNFGISISYNIVAVGLAMAGWITPLVAAALMPASSLTVLGLTLASPTNGEPSKAKHTIPGKATHLRES